MELDENPVNKNLKFSVSFIFISLLILNFASCDLLKNNEDDSSQTFAYLITSTINFNPAESEKLFWIKMPGPGFLIYSGSDQITPVVYEIGNTVPASDSVTFHQDYNGDTGIGAIEFRRSSNYYFIRFNRGGDLSSMLSIEAQIQFIHPGTVYTEANLSVNKIFSPVISFPSGQQVTDLGEGTVSFANFVDLTYYYDYTVGIAFLEYILLQELPFIDFADETGNLPKQNPLLIPGPTPPAGAKHNKNYCGISAFIHSMLTTFPGALPADVTSNAAEWDKIGDAIDHSNTFGERAAKLVSNVNDNFGNKTTYVMNGKKYRAQILYDNISTSDISMLMEIGCDIKLLIYDIPEFGHWVDVTGVDGTSLILQDYGVTLTVTYHAFTEMIDFSSAPSSTMSNHFSGSDHMAGDSPFESITFVSICEIE